MIPRHDIQAGPRLPVNTTTDQLRLDQFDEEGYGVFRGVWSLGIPDVAEAREALVAEATIVDELEVMAADPEEFEGLASLVETYDDEDLDRLILDFGHLDSRVVHRLAEAHS